MKARLFLMLASSIIFTGCSGIAPLKPINPAAYSQHPIMYEVAYDLDCVAGRGTYPFKKGQRFAVSNLGGEKLYDGVGVLAEFVHLPKNILGLRLFENAPLGSLDFIIYGLINPDGNFAADFHFGYYNPHRGRISSISDSIKACKLKGEKPLFKKVTNQ